MPTYLVGPTRTYTTIVAAVAAIPSNISGTGEHVLLVDSGVYSGNVSFKKLGQSSVDFISLGVRAGDEHQLSLVSSVGVEIAGTSTVSSPVVELGSYNRLKNLRARDAGITYSCFLATGGQVGIDLENCIGIGGGSFALASGCFVSNSSSQVSLKKCLSVVITGGHGFHITSPSGTPSYLYNCGAYDALRSGFNLVNAVSKNCWSTNRSSSSFADFVVSGGSHNNNASSDTSAPGSNSLVNLTDGQFGFVNKGVDFHLLSSSLLMEAGDNLSSSFSEDIDNETIEVWAIGPDSRTPNHPPVPGGSEERSWSRKTKNKKLPHSSLRKFSKTEERVHTSASLETKKTPESAKEVSGSEAVDHSSKSPSRNSSQSPASPKFSSSWTALFEDDDVPYTTFNQPQPLDIITLSLNLNKEITVSANQVSDTPVANIAAVVYKAAKPEGGFTYDFRSSDILKVLMAHYQLGTAAVTSSPYRYHFYPKKNPLNWGITGTFCKGPYAPVEGRPYSVSVLKKVVDTNTSYGGTNAVFYKHGICDKLTFSLQTGDDAKASASFKFRDLDHGTAVSANPNSASVGSYAETPSFVSTGASVVINGVQVDIASFVLNSEQAVQEFSRVGRQAPENYNFSSYSARGNFSFDLPLDAMKEVGSMFGSQTFSFLATVANSASDRVIFDMPNCRRLPFDYNAQSGDSSVKGQVPFEAFETNGTYPMRVTVDTTYNFSALLT